MSKGKARRVVRRAEQVAAAIGDGFDEVLAKPAAWICESRIGAAILAAGYMHMIGLLIVAAKL